MYKFIKIGYEEFINKSNLVFDKRETFEYYQIINEKRNNFFVVFNNSYHSMHTYIYPKFAVDEKEDITNLFNNIKKYFEKPLQVMIDSSETEVIDLLARSGFELKRKSFECSFKKDDVSKHYQRSNFTIIDKTNLLYEEAAVIAYDNYVNNHKRISPLTASFSRFKQILPNNLYVEIDNRKILNYAFVDENEIYYVGSNRLDIFDNFIYTVINKLFENYKDISFEADDNDELMMKLKEIFNNLNDESFDTYILE